jgi:hypothetical protein
VQVEAGLDRHPVLEGSDTTAAPAPDLVKPSASLCNPRKRRVSMRGILSDLVLKVSCELLMFDAGGRIFHASNSTKHLFERKPIYSWNLFAAEVGETLPSAGSPR